MHTIITVPDGGGWRAECSCNWVSNRYGTREQAQSVGYNHKEQQGNNLNQRPGGSDDPRIGW